MCAVDKKITSNKLSTIVSYRRIPNYYELAAGSRQNMLGGAS